MLLLLPFLLILLIVGSAVVTVLCNFSTVLLHSVSSVSLC